MDLVEKKKFSDALLIYDNMKRQKDGKQNCKSR